MILLFEIFEFLFVRRTNPGFYGNVSKPSTIEDPMFGFIAKILHFLNNQAFFAKILDRLRNFKFLAKISAIISAKKRKTFLEFFGKMNKKVSAQVLEFSVIIYSFH